MLIDDNTFKSIFSIISGAKSNPVNWNFKANFIDSTTNTYYPVHNIIAKTKLSVYSNSKADTLFVSLQVYKSVYLSLLKVNRKMLRFQLISTPNAERGSTSKISPSKTEYYDAYLTDNTSEAIETRSGKLTGTHIDDLGELKIIDVQLVETGLSEFRLYKIGGTYRNSNIYTILQSLMSTPLKALNKKMTTGYGVSIVPPDNNTLYYQFPIPSNVGLDNLPGWIQKNWGVYSTGIGWYLSSGIWHICPLYDVTRYKKETTRMTIINIPRNEMIGNPNSYAKQGSELFLFATGNTKHFDNTDRNLDKTGSGFISGIAGNNLDKFTVSSKGNTTIPPGRNMVSVNFDSRESNIQNIKPTTDLLSSNPWENASKIISKMGNVIKVFWEYSDDTVLEPYMPVRFIYKYLDKPYSLYGVLLSATTDVKTPLESALDERYKSTTELTLYVERATQ